MKKIILILIFILSYEKVFAIENIKIDNNTLSPFFDVNTKKYNFFTYEDNISINVVETTDEIITGEGDYTLVDGLNIFKIISSKDGEFILNVYKNYIEEEDIYLKSLTIDGYDISFNRYKYVYDININEEDNLNINYELSNDEGYVSITGNGNFNDSNNKITINVNGDEEYIINVHKTIKVSYIEEETFVPKEMTNIKKGIVISLIITISLILILLFHYIVFKDKTILQI